MVKELPRARPQDWILGQGCPDEALGPFRETGRIGRLKLQNSDANLFP